AGGIETLNYQEYVSKVHVQQLVFLFVIPVVIALMLVLRTIFFIISAKIKQVKKNQPTPFFINDHAIENKEDDSLGIIDNATRFAERVLNGGSPDSLVFGIDAPRGIGKTSFLNFCCAHWKDKTNSRPIVFRFEPLRYKDSADLVDEFVNELVNTIREHAFIPSIRSLFSKYLRLLKGNNSFSFFGIKFELESGTVDETLKTLEVHLSELNRKIIIVVDDLDRLSWTEVKNILFAIKRSFILPNVSYVNSAHEIKPEFGSDVLIYLMKHLPDYTFFEKENVGAGSRVNLGYSLLKLLEKAAWGIGLAGRRNNSDENISEIAEWVFGEGRHISNGVVSTLSKPERGPLGLFDLLLFRLYCSADRGGSFFNLQRAISLHSNPNATTSGLTTEIAKEGMREISQVAFQVFLKQYIEPNINIFEAIDNLSLEDFAGKTFEFVRKQIEAGEIRQNQIDELIAIENSHVKSFIIYQLGNSMISSGVGCGYYDETGNADHKGIAKKINDYLFDQCFNPSISHDNYEFFLGYLLLNFAHTFEPRDGFSYEPSVSEFTKVLDKERLKKYWSLHKNEVLALNLCSKNKRVVTGNYVVTYEHNLHAAYCVLDELIEV
ncbi:MAG: KAP family NTPase, partial [Pseudomonadota bacterium]|nr:KAP family NTPase [Pseudomonadota bacterium]